MAMRKYDPDRPMTRRSVLEWLGKGAVLTLGGAALASCLGPATPRGDGGFPDDGDEDGDGAGGEGGGGDAGGGLTFQPGAEDHPVYRGWGERTVDRQELESILSSWHLRVDGLVEMPRDYTFADLVGLGPREFLVDFHCVEGWSILDVPWDGLHLSRLFDAARVRPQATHVTFHTLGGRYNESWPLAVALEPRSLLALGIGGNTLPLKHGFPARAVLPRMYAYKSPKYVARIELADHPIEGFWVENGYPYDAPVPATKLRPGRY
ncbi:MAG TPA: molybdopterin-dependent oxidoreductase [Myxococcota bacterium]|nr:molybdopterin-dependent oxidoreductase [Myxococcota bacterium]HRY94599.1 molybdopterin-dependent oxidoreductase [Myxococcota bacterium]HSA20319.1 molybdopterin-dependent oxidoreductase [Myxococcota bacterium]